MSNNNFDQERENLEKKLASKGYVHPESNSQSLGPYKTYSETSENVYESTSINTYSTFSENRRYENRCPLCKSIPNIVYSNNNFSCKNEHFWHLLNDGFPVLDEEEEN